MIIITVLARRVTKLWQCTILSISSSIYDKSLSIFISRYFSKIDIRSNMDIISIVDTSGFICCWHFTFWQKQQRYILTFLLVFVLFFTQRVGNPILGNKKWRTGYFLTFWCSTVVYVWQLRLPDSVVVQIYTVFHDKYTVFLLMMRNFATVGARSNWEIRWKIQDYRYNVSTRKNMELL